MNSTPERTSLSTLGCIIRALPLTALLTACGGGDDGGSAGPGPTPTPPSEIDQPITEMPTSSYTGDKLAAFIRLNEARLAAGVSAVEQNAQLDAAAQAHATYQVRNYVTGHGEDPDKPWFTGQDPLSRALVQGYTDTPVVEIISYDPPGVEAIESFLSSVYHLHGLLDPRANQIGIGVDRTTTPGPLSSTSITLGTTANGLLATGPLWHWPTGDQQDVNPRFAPARESPNPAPDLEIAGTPIMLCGALDNYAMLKISKAALQEEGSATTVPIRLLVSSALQAQDGVEADVVEDANLTPASIYQGCVFLLPTIPLEFGKTYEVQISATQAGEPVNATWQFRTRHPS
ncbi:MAG: CAP domain-containing protein [Pigmentiphaga sp.]|uniref:CAP domain-containing protein n=1 Tax=Pigmentiphaga sp. TaxID=1977564 RepID=UPI0029B7E974|nr:CAP domain-containing protein [Pigmentiphaga sp.]MDX3907353.1 CAP domain-containing protein [Pigmentiphaga sp.]